MFLVGEQGVGKTTLIVEALRRLTAPVVRVPGGRLRRQRRADLHRDARGPHEGDRRADRGRAILWLFPNFEEALWAGQHPQSPRGLLDALLPHVESGEVVVVGEIDPLAFELFIQERPRLARLSRSSGWRRSPRRTLSSSRSGWATQP